MEEILYLADVSVVAPVQRKTAHFSLPLPSVARRIPGNTGARAVSTDV